MMHIKIDPLYTCQILLWGTKTVALNWAVNVYFYCRVGQSNVGLNGESLTSWMQAGCSPSANIHRPATLLFGSLSVSFITVCVILLLL